MALSISLSRKSSSLEFDEIEDTYEKYAGGETMGALIIDDRINYIRDECDQFAAGMFGKGADKLEVRPVIWPPLKIMEDYYALVFKLDI